MDIRWVHKTQSDGPKSRRYVTARACAKCYHQKLRCFRSNRTGPCDRCLSTETECMDRQYRPAGRPPRIQETAAPESVPEESASQRRASISENQQAAESSHDAEQAIEHAHRPPSPIRGYLQANVTKRDGPAIYSLTQWDARLQPRDSTAPPLEELTNYIGPMFPWGHFSTLLPSFERNTKTTSELDLVETIEDLDDDESSRSSHETAGFEFPQLDLRLQRILQRLRGTETDVLLSAGGDPSSTLIWVDIKKVFAFSEIFIDLLEASEPGSSSRDPPQLTDESTGLMALNCFTRILQNFQLLMEIALSSPSQPLCANPCDSSEPTRMFLMTDQPMTIRALSPYISQTLQSMIEIVKKKLSGLSSLGRAVDEVTAEGHRVRHQALRIANSAPQGNASE